MATEEQREQLENIVQFWIRGQRDWYPKQIMIIMDMLPEDTPCITLEQAQAICAEIDPSDYDDIYDFEMAIIERFNEIAGAPDFDGGSGFTTRLYYLDSEHTEYLSIAFGFVDYTDADGNRTDIFSYCGLPEENWPSRFNNEKLIGRTAYVL